MKYTKINPPGPAYNPDTCAPEESVQSEKRSISVHAIPGRGVGPLYAQGSFLYQLENQGTEDMQRHLVTEQFMGR